MRHSYKAARHTNHMEGPTTERSVCFELLGFDVFLDKKLRPFIIEVNRSPSFTCDSQLDFDIKFAAVATAIKMLHLRFVGSDDDSGNGRPVLSC